jgi:hypothetical protein
MQRCLTSLQLGLDFVCLSELHVPRQRQPGDCVCFIVGQAGCDEIPRETGCCWGVQKIRMRMAPCRGPCCAPPFLPLYRELSRLGDSLQPTFLLCPASSPCYALLQQLSPTLPQRSRKPELHLSPTPPAMPPFHTWLPPTKVQTLCNSTWPCPISLSTRPKLLENSDSVLSLVHPQCLEHI